jgi:hypothetical protein
LSTFLEVFLCYIDVWFLTGENVNKYQVPEITRLKIKQDEDKSTKKKEYVRYIKVWKRNERK